MKTTLLLTCCECKVTSPAAYEGDRLSPSVVYREIGWILSVIEQSDNMIVLAPLCPTCQPKHHSPEVLAAGRRALENPPKAPKN